MTDRFAARPFEDETLAVIRRKAIRLCRSSLARTYDVDDLAQELAVRVFLARRKYDPARLSWEAYLRMVLCRAASDLIRRACARKRDNSQTVTLNEHYNEAQPAEFATNGNRALHRGYSPRDDQSRLQLRLDVARVIGFLSPRDKVIAKMLTQNTLKEIAQQLGIDRGTVAIRLKSIRSQFSKAELKEYLPG